jgi:XRE family transcriptional regulator, regulator of sulfur utilization
LALGARRVRLLLGSSNDTLRAFGQVVREEREARGMSQWDLSDAAGLHRNTPGLIERGERTPSLLTVDAIAKAFGMPASELVRRTEEVRENRRGTHR